MILLFDEIDEPLYFLDVNYHSQVQGSKLQEKYAISNASHRQIDQVQL